MSDYVYLQREHAPVTGEASAAPLTGELPKDLVGTFARNSPNPRFEPIGKYHWFDGDGMVHAIQVRDGQGTYRARWIQTDGLRAEVEAGKALFTGILEKPRPGAPGPLKDTANTDLVWHNGKLLALWWLSGTPCALSLPSLETIGPERFNGKLPRGMAAHAKVDATSGELMFFEFSMFKPPFYRYGVVSNSGELTSCEVIDVAGPRIPHDIAITPRFTVLLDLPLGWDAAALAAGKRRIGFDRSGPARLGVIPRHGKGSEVKWFDISPCYSYHTVNAYEDGPNVVLVSCAIDDPIPSKHDDRTPMLDSIALVPRLKKWTMNLETGSVKEEILDDTPTEFPRTNEAIQGQRVRFSYHGRMAPRSAMMFDALVKYDLEKGTHRTIDVPKGWFAGEPSFAPRIGATSEDDGYIVTVITNAEQDASEFWVVEARTLDTVARAKLPRRIPIGFHSTWVRGV
ncbi:MAG: carotenoid oxygenase family protein [Myxococcaceae bacterium]